ncbi:hypothetical protein J1N35_040508 [Gossypium stocksii]|uniref:Uncharacterized protein n=1 Tax=Gossypium stocksii TaxID=47602 RepID=A0A9D3UE18_9ROSI|nr:hypothetical protein J1N35_040508 [Gossypium stocksii]
MAPPQEGNVFQYCLQELSPNANQVNESNMGLDASFSTSNQAKSPVDDARLPSHSNTQDMDISSILKGTHSLGKTTVTSSKKIVEKKTKKRVRIEESTQESSSSDCPPLIGHRPRREPVATVSPTLTILTLLEIPSLLEESAYHPATIA